MFNNMYRDTSKVVHSEHDIIYVNIIEELIDSINGFNINVLNKQECQIMLEEVLINVSNVLC